MTKHLIISAITIAIIAIVALAMWGTVDPLTQGSRDEILADHSLGDSVPTVVVANDSGDAATDYHEAIEYFIANYNDLRSKTPSTIRVAHLARLLLRASDKAKTTDGFADHYVPVQPSAKPQYYNAPVRIADLLLNRAASKTDAKGKREMLSVWVFGRRLYEHNIRIYPRQAGIGIMQNVSITYSKQYGENDSAAKKMAQWIPKLDELSRDWDEKMKAIHVMHPSIGDLVHIADDDQDKGFRIEALLEMGRVQWMTNGHANLSALHNCMERYAHSDDAQFVAAAHAAEQFSREDVRMIH